MPSLFIRVAIGKAVGFIFGLVGFFALPYFDTETDWLLRWGILLWYPTVGAVIGVFGVLNRHPVLELPLPWWVRAPLVGGWMNFVLMFFAYEDIMRVVTAMFGPGSPWASPVWVVVEGIVVGLAIGFLATRAGGEGRETLSGR